MAALNGEDPRRPREVEPEPDVYEAEGLGLTVETLNARLREPLRLGEEQTGVVVTDVEFGSPASDKGFVPNMVITAINDQSVESVSDWRRLLEQLEPGSSVKIDVLIARARRPSSSCDCPANSLATAPPGAVRCGILRRGVRLSPWPLFSSSCRPHELEAQAGRTGRR